MPASTPPNTHPDIPPFPPPSTFSILPDIYLLLARLRLLNNASSDTTTNTQHSQLNGALGTQHSQTQALSSTSAPPTQGITTSTQSQSTIPPALLNNASLLDLKDLPAQLFPLKQRLAKARAAVSELPDVDRTVQEQEEEIKNLEEMVRALRRREAHVAGIARREGQREEVVVEKEERADVDMGEGDEQVGT